MPRKARILLVEDNNADVKIITDALNNINNSCHIIHFSDGAEALRYLSHSELYQPLPDLILLDINLPKVNGIHLLKEIKSHPLYSVVPVVILTSSSLPADRQEANDLKVNDYLVKPFDVKEYQQAVKDVWGQWIAKDPRFRSLDEENV